MISENEKFNSIRLPHDFIRNHLKISWEGKKFLNSNKNFWLSHDIIRTIVRHLFLNDIYSNDIYSCYIYSCQTFLPTTFLPRDIYSQWHLFPVTFIPNDIYSKSHLFPMTCIAKTFIPKNGNECHWK